MKKEYNFKKAKRGPVAAPDTKVMRTIRLDLDVLSWLMQESERTRIPYQTLINSILKQEMDRRQILGKTEALNTVGISELIKEIELKFGTASTHRSSKSTKENAG